MSCVEKGPGAGDWRGLKLGGALSVAVGTGLVIGLAIPFNGEAQEPQTLEAPIGLVINYIRPAGTADFESIMLQAQQALMESEDEERRAQGEGWTVYKAQETGPNNQAVYLWLLDPAVAGGDYSVPQILAEAFPADAQQLYETYKESFGAGQIWLNLEPLATGDGAGGADDTEPNR